jgi:acyl-CoA thioester hydrolase
MRLEIPDKKILTNELRTAIRWGDMDAMGHVNNTIYFRYFEMARIEWFESLDCRPSPNDTGPVIVNAFCHFIKQLEFPGDILIRHYAAHPGRTSFDTYMTIERIDHPGTVYTTGYAKIVWVDFPKQKSVPLPEAVRRLVE